MAQYQDALNKSASLNKLRQDLTTKFNSISVEDKDRLDKMIPDSVDNIRLILDIDSIARVHGMRILGTKIIQGPSADERNNPTIVDTKPYSSMGLSFSVTSSYDNFLNFLNDLEHSLRIVDITGIQIQPQRTGVYSFSVNLKTYWLKPR